MQNGRHNPGTWETKAGKLLQTLGQPGLHRCLGYWMRSCLCKEKVVITTETAVADGCLSADKDFLILLHMSQVRRQVCWSVCPPHGLPRLPGWVMISFLMIQTFGSSYLQFLLQCLQAWPATKQGGPEVFRSLCFCTEQEHRGAEAACHLRVFTITPTLRVPKAFRLSAVHISNNLKFHSLTSKGKVEDKPPKAEVGDTSEWKKKKNKQTWQGQCSPFLLPDLRLLDWAGDWVRHHVMQ